MKTKRRFLAVALVAVMVISTLAPVAIFAAAGEIRVTLHGEDVDFGNDSPVLIDSRTYVPRWFIVELVGADVPLADTAMLPLRSTMENLGHIIEWDSTTRTANILLVTVEEEMANDASTVFATFINHLVDGNVENATMMLSPEMQQVFPINIMVFGMHGAILDYAIMDSQQAEGFDIFVVSVTHTKGNAVHQVVVNDVGTIAGFQTLSFDFKPRLPGETDTFTAEPVVIGEDWPLDGLLTLPQGASAETPVPAVILVHGSGTHNMDQSIFENRVFADIAEYLSNNGIAVLRYNKRNFAHPERFAQIGLDEMTIDIETVDDALLAAELLQADPRINQIFVLGHSLGGVVAPRIAEEANLDGIILFAALTRAFHLNSFDQSVISINTMVELGIWGEAEVAENMALIEKLMEEAVAAGEWAADELAGREIFGIPAVYARSVSDFLPIPLILESGRPVLALQGDRDPQTTVEGCFQYLLDNVGGLPHVTTRLYQGLNHLMMTSQFPDGPLVMDPTADMSVPGRVNEQVLRDIAEWILAQ